MNVTKMFGAAAFAALFGAFLPSCGNSGAISLDCVAVQETEDIEWGLLAADGDVLCNDEFTYCPSSVFNGYFIVSENDSYSVYKAGKHPVLVPGLDGLESAGFYSEGVIPVCRDKEAVSLVEKDGNVRCVISSINDVDVESVAGFFNCGVANVTLENGKVGAIDPWGEVVIEPTWSGINWFNNGVAIAWREDDSNNTRYYVIDNTGAELCRIARNLQPLSGYFAYEILPATKGTDDDYVAGFINKRGDFAKVSSKVKGISEWNAEYFVFTEDYETYGVMTMKGEVLIQPKYQSLEILSGGNFLAKKSDSLYVIINPKDEELVRLKGEVEKLIPESFDMFKSSISMIYKRSDGKYYLLDDNGEYDESKPMHEIYFMTPSQIVKSQL